MSKCSPLFLVLAFGLGGAAVAQEPGKTSPKKSPPNPAKLTVPQRNIYLSTQRGMEWLHKANKPDGRFVYGLLPALRTPMEGDDFIHQAGAAFALGRAARFFEDERAGAIARQAVLTLLLETTVDAKEKHLRYSAAPPQLVNRVAATGFLVLAIHDLPVPGADLLEQAEQMTAYLRTRFAADGTIRVVDTIDVKDSVAARDAEAAMQHFSGPALYAVIRSHALKPAAWKLEVLRKACPAYHGLWQRSKNMPMVAWHTAAYAEAFEHTKENAFADCVFAMNDWLCEQQYAVPDPRRSHWTGGFMPWRDGRVSAGPPDVSSAQAAFSLSQACRVARRAGDATRLARYQKALESALYFLTTLQYTDGSVQHFADWFRPALVGGFHASHQDGNLRIDYNQHCLLAQVDYFGHVLGH